MKMKMSISLPFEENSFLRKDQNMIKSIIPMLPKDFYHIQDTKWVTHYEYHKVSSYYQSVNLWKTLCPSNSTRH